MLFISILLSVWFALWLMYAIFVKDVGKLFVSWLKDSYEDSEKCDDDEDIDPLLEKSENGGVYHLNCDHCNHIWWSVEPNVNYCPNCGKKPHE